MAEKTVGKPIKRTEDPRLIQGLAHYVDDVRLPDTLHAAFLRSIYAHARIKSIDTTAAQKLPGVVAVYTGKDVQKIGVVPCGAAIPEMKMPEHRILGMNKVYFVGHPVAVVVAETKAAARDAVDLIEVDYEELPVVMDEEKAADPKSPVIHEALGTNIAYKLTAGEGDIEAALKGSDKIIKQKILHKRLAPIAMEPRGVLARYFPGEQELTIWTSTQIPHLVRTQVAIMLGVPENKLRVITPEVGGGFGSKLNVYAEEAMLGWLSMQTGRPVKWIEGRRENMQATIHGRGQTGYVEIGCKNDGTITGFRYNVFADMGSYFQLLTPAIPTLTGLMLSGCYKIPAIQMNVTATFTNKVATDAYRGAGRPEATYVIERAADLVAAELGMDPVEVRRKNFPQPNEFPFKTATGLFYDSGNYQGALDKALKMADYTKLREDQKKARKAGRIMGIGVSTYVEICAIGPSAATPAGGWESATVRIEPTGKVTILTGASPHGQGEETAFAQIAADELGVSVHDSTVIHGDTAIVQYGIGTFGSRGLAVGGTAVYMAIQKLKVKAGKLAAHLLQVDAATVSFADGKFTSSAAAGKQVTIQEIALAAHLARSLPEDMEPGLSATAFYEPKNFTFPFGTHIAVVDIDPETGEIHFQRYIAVDDCGKQINPMLVAGQVHGGIVQSMGQALFEEVVYDETGQLITGTLMDYALPKAVMIPHLELDSTITPSPVNPLGAKGVGEAGTIGATPAIVAAVVDALAPYGVRHIDMPIKPEVVWQLIKNGPKKNSAGAA